jgi:hypothetical protein
MNLIAAARSTHALTSTVVRGAAAWHRWSGVEPAPELFLGAARLHLGNRTIAVRLVPRGATNLADVLAHLQLDALSGAYPEQFIVMADFPANEIEAYQARFASALPGSITVGSVEAYVAWLQARLGPVAALTVGSPLRRLAEGLIEVNARPEPTVKRPAARIPERSDISRSFRIGRDGVQCFETLFAHALGTHNVLNLEEDRPAQEQGFDLLLHAGQGAGIKVEVKTEDYASGNISLETYSCYRAKIPYCQIERQTPGWLLTSSADILATILWPTGDMLLADFRKVREWAIGRRPGVPLREGTVAEQRYYSRLYLANLSMLLREVPDALLIRLGDWMPALYQAKFAKPTTVSGRACEKTLQPQRLG